MAVSLPSSSPLPVSFPSNLLTRSRILSPLSHALQLNRLLADEPVGSTRSFSLRSASPRIGAFAADSSSAVDSELSTELDAVFPPTAATVSSSLLLGICSLPDTKFRGIEAAKLLESEGIQTHLTFVYSFPQAAAAAQAGASVIQIFVGRIRVILVYKEYYSTFITITHDKVYCRTGLEIILVILSWMLSAGKGKILD
ncbi:hypothetical protein GW17_00016329 [Ensete ventricosum]|nr:hypothetical protein GW17_00016329 [Ensete ventricosum]